MTEALKRIRSAVAGGAGFLGSHLCTRLLERGDEVVCIDDFSTGTAANIAPLRSNAAFSVMEHDVAAPFRLDVDRIYNLACPASPVHYQADPLKTFKTSVLGALNLLEEAQRTGARILQASTSEVYGDPHVHPQPESYWGHVNPIGPRSCYDEGKRAAETLFFDHMRTRGTDIRVVRIFNTYGPRMRSDDGRVVSNFVVQALRGEDITIYGDGSQTRSFCFVDDLIEVILRVMDAEDCGPGPFNIGNPGEFTMIELAEKVVSLTGSGSRIAHRPLPVDDPRQRRPDITAVKRATGWEPTIRLDDGLARTISYFREAIAAGSDPR